MKKHLLSIIASIVICAALLIGCGGGGGGGGSSTPSEPSEFIYSTEVNSKGTFRLTSSKSGAIVESSENGTLATGSSIVLTERLAKSNESKLYGGNSSNIYTLQAKNDNKTIKKLDKPVILTIPNNFGKEFKTFFLGSRSETASDWQYTQILDDNDTNPTVVKSARLAVKDLSTFKIKIYRLSYSFAIFASKEEYSEDKPANSDSVKSMHFSAVPTTIYYDKNSKYITDIKVSSCITANKSSALFDGSEVTSQLVFFNGNSADLSGIKIDGATANQSSSTTKDSSTNQYSHTLYIKSYKKNNISISGNNATYTFELKLTGVPINDFPESFRVKTVLKDTNGTEFASEGSIQLKKAKEPQKTDTKTNTNTSTSTLTKTSTNTSTSTGTKTATNTKTSTSTNTETNTSTSSSTATQTSTGTNTASNTESNTSTKTETQTTTELSVSITPTNSETVKVEVTTPIKITFNEKMNKTQNLLNLVTLTSNKTSTNLITASNQLEWSTENDKDVLTIKNVKLQPENIYSINLSKGLKTEKGLVSKNKIISKFLTRDKLFLIPLNANGLMPSYSLPLDARIKFAPVGGTISDVSKATIERVGGRVSLENGKVYLDFPQNSPWLANYDYNGIIKGILDQDGCEIRECNFQFDTYPNPYFSNRHQLISLYKDLEISECYGISNWDFSSARTVFENADVQGNFIIENNKILFRLNDNSYWPSSTTVKGKINGIKDNKGSTVIDDLDIAFTTKAGLPTIQLTKPNQDTLANLDEKLEFTVLNVNEIDSSNAIMKFDNCTVNGYFSSDSNNSNFSYTPYNKQIFPLNTLVTGKISGIKVDNRILADYSFSFNTRKATILSLENPSMNDYVLLSGNLVFKASNKLSPDIGNVSIIFNNSTVTGTLSLVDSNQQNLLVFSPNPNQYWEKGTVITGKIVGLKDYNELPIEDYSFSFSTTFFEGKGTESEPFLISTANDLNNLRYVSNGSYFKQTQDIDLSAYGTSYDNGKGWMPIPSANELFYPYNPKVFLPFDNINTWYGYYDGNNHKITNLYINNRNAVGLFNRIVGNIKNLGIEISNDGVQGNIGAGLACYIYSDTPVTNCWIGGTGKIICSEDSAGLFCISKTDISSCYSTVDVEGKNLVGGLIANYLDGNIDSCYSTGNVVANSKSIHIGGLVGYVGQYYAFDESNSSSFNYFSSNEGVTINNSYTTGNVTGFVNTSGGVGGLVGINYFSQRGSFTISKCYSTGDITGGIYTGGLVGSSSGYNSSSISESYSSGNITGEDYTGGLVGYSDSISISKCYSLGNVIGTDSTGGIVGYIGSSSGYSSINNTYSLSNITGGNNTGGFIGYIKDSNIYIQECFSKGEVNGGGATGGFVGAIEDCSSGYFVNCYSTCNTSGGRYVGGFIGSFKNVRYLDSSLNVSYSYSTGNISGNYYVSGFIGYFISNYNYNKIESCYAGNSSIVGAGHRVINISYGNEPYISIVNCYANKNMTITVNGVSTQPGLQNPLPETVALDGVDGENILETDPYLWRYITWGSGGDVWEMGSSGLPILKNMPGNPVQ